MTQEYEFAHLDTYNYNEYTSSGISRDFVRLKIFLWCAIFYTHNLHL